MATVSWNTTHSDCDTPSVPSYLLWQQASTRQASVVLPQDHLAEKRKSHPKERNIQQVLCKCKWESHTALQSLHS
ncbi:hypothetical protein Y1Q_0024066 [Alligator mississippiensis]|uniref:Uncharacterized protein n=1 Tax=Alligator mississippiensis TaxID=8496 RepID=A0A151NHM1_ALLMI|nr:hypothetical protein Y1Q_0024066 [Alligator mississippiensis]